MCTSLPELKDRDLCERGWGVRHRSQMRGKGGFNGGRNGQNGQNRRGGFSGGRGGRGGFSGSRGGKGGFNGGNRNFHNDGGFRKY